MNQANIHNLAISENGFVFDPTTGYSYNTNELGIHLLKLMQQNHNHETIVTMILDEYDVSRENLERDMDFFLLQLKSFQLIGD